MNHEIFQIVAQYLKKKYPEISLNIDTSNYPIYDNSLSEQEIKEEIINGKWDELIKKLQSKKDSDELVKVVLFKLFEQKIQETLEKRNQTEALEILRSCLSPLKIFPDRIHQLAQDILLMRDSPTNRYILAQEVCRELRKVSGLLLPENRLEELVEEALEYQKIKCPFHVNNQNENDFGIWTDHKCKRDGPIKLKAEDVQRREVSVDSEGELLNIYMSTDEENVFLIDDDNNVHIYNFCSPTFKTKNMASHKMIQSITFWPRITDKLPEIIEKEIKISSIFKNEEDKNKSFLVENPLSIAITADEQYMICSTEGQITTIFDLKDGKVSHSWIRLRCSHLLTPQNPADKYFLAVSDNGSILQISTETFETMRTIPSMNERLQVSSAYLDRERLLIGYNNSTIYYYEDWRGYEHPTRIFRGHTCTKFRVNSILSRYDRNLAISCAENGSIYGWNIETGRLIYEIDIHEKCSNDVMEIGPGRFMTCGDDGKVYEWKLK